MIKVSIELIVALILGRNKSSNYDHFLYFRLGKSHDKEWLVSEKDKFDNDYDKDKDGRLNPNEILSWVVPSNE